jgi:hypothetical protein
MSLDMVWAEIALAAKRKSLAMVCFSGNREIFQENREAIKHEPGNRREGSGA